MYIQSRIKELNQTLYELTVPDSANEDSPIICRKPLKLKTGEGEIECLLTYMDGMCIIESNFTLTTACTDLMTIKKDYIQFSLLLSGQLSIFKKHNNSVKDVKVGMLQLAYRKESDAHMEMPVNKEGMRYFRIFLSRSFYLSLLSNEKWLGNDQFYNDVQNNNYVPFGNILIPIDHNIFQIITDIVNNKYEDSLKKVYIKSKLRELFLTVHLYCSSKNSFSGINAETMVKLEAAKAYLGVHFSDPPTIKSLSRIVFLNELKLKQGFKQAFGIPIRAYLTELRMEKAKLMIMDKHAVNEIASLLGYKSVSHFIATYKKKHGITPKQFILKNLSN